MGKAAAAQAGRPADDDPRLQLVHLLRGVTVQLDLFGAQFAARNGLHPTDVRALICLLDAARTADVTPTPGWLGGRLGMNSAAVTALVDRLERLGLIGRERDTADRRRVLLVVSDRAAALGWSFFGPLIGRMVEALSVFEEAELDVARRFLEATGEAVAQVRHEQEQAGSGPPA
jgi:DNA-binding MarR family transcriptional regulator